MVTQPNPELPPDRQAEPDHKINLNPEKNPNQGSWKRISVSGFFQTALAMINVCLKRIRFNLGLTISTEIGILAILILVVTIPLFTNAILSEILQEQLRQKAEKNHRSLFSLHAYYLDQKNFSPVTVEGADAVTTYIRQEIEERMGLSVERVVMEMTTQQMLWKPVKTRSISPPFQYLYLSLLSNNLLPQGVEFVEGKVPEFPSNQPDRNPKDPTIAKGNMDGSPVIVPVAVYEKMADDNFMNVGDIYQAKEFLIEVVGIFRAKDPGDQGWFYSPDTTFSSSVWVPADYFETILPVLLERPQNITSWYTIVNDTSLRFERSQQYSRQMVRLDAGLKSMAPNIRIDYSPLDMLQIYEQRLQSVTILFIAAGAPMILLAFLFTSLTASIAVQQTITETVTMRTRGMSLSQALSLNVLESMILIAVALPLVFVFSWLGAFLIGQSQSFLQFGGFETQNRFSFSYLSIQDINLAWLGLALLVIIITRAAPVVSLWRSPVVEIKQKLARQASHRMAQPFWQRYYLDFALLIPSMYVFFTQRELIKPLEVFSNLKVTGGNDIQEFLVRPGDQLSYDPLVFLSASLFAVACCMIGLRLLPLTLRLFRNFLNRISRPWSYLAVQEIIRRPQDHTNTLLLIMIALCLSIYSASMARTLSLWMYESRSYKSGADLVIREFRIDPASGSNPASSASGEAVSTAGQAGTNPPPGTSSQPVSGGAPSLVHLDRHLEIPEITHSTYAGRFDCRYSYSNASPSGGEKECQILGIDRLTFPNVAFFRPDFMVESRIKGGDAVVNRTPPSLGALMNALAAQSRGVLAPQSLLEQTGLMVGDKIKLKTFANDLGLNFNDEVVITGVYKYFPTVYPDDKLTLIMNLETLFGSYEAIVGYDVWLGLEPGVSSAKVIEKIQELAQKDRMGIQVMENSSASLEEAKSQPEWTGLFGVLNLGFFLTALMPGIGFILYSFASLRKRTIELGILQALGLSHKQLIGSLVLEQFVLMSIAITAGILIGYLTSLLFLPVLQTSIVPRLSVPQFRILIGWIESTWLSLYFFIVLSATIAWTIVYLSRLKIFQAVKMGESIS